MSMKSLVGKRTRRDYKFIGENITIQKLTVEEALSIQEAAKNREADSDGMELVKMVIRFGVEGGNELSDEDFNTFPLDDLGKLSDEILKFSGMGEKGK